MDNQNSFNMPTPQPVGLAPQPLSAAPQVAPQPTPGYNPLDQSYSKKPKNSGHPVLISALVFAMLATFVFIGLFIWMYLQYDEAKTDVDSQISQAVATAVNENSMKLEEEFLEREKEPNRTFSGPEDYGELSFKYPKTWSVYVQSDAANGGTYQAYFSPNQIAPITNNTPNALRLSITAQSFESSVKTYESYVNSGRMTMKVMNINGNPANLYTGTLPSNLSGAVCLIKIRDKTVLLQTDSELYMSDFLKLLNSITYNS